MKSPLLAIALILASGSCAGAQEHAPQPCDPGNRGWCPAEYRALVMGRSSVTELLRVLGEPRSVDAPGPDEPGGPLPLAVYYFGDVAGDQVEAYVSRPDDVVLMVVEYPQGLTRDDLTARLGFPGREQGYDFDPCLLEFDGGPVYESDDGMLRVLEYRSRGIAALLNGRGEVNQIEYLSEPYGAAASSCPPAQNEGDGT